MDAAAERIERAAARHQDRAVELDAKAERLRAKAGRQRGRARARLAARADDALTQAAIRRQRARGLASRAVRHRSEASRLRAQARRRAKGVATPPPQRGSSRISLASTAPCRVLVDGAFVGWSPVASLRVAAGRHRVECTTVDGASVRSTVVTRAGTVRAVRFDPKPGALVDPF